MAHCCLLRGYTVIDAVQRRHCGGAPPWSAAGHPDRGHCSAGRRHAAGGGHAGVCQAPRRRRGERLPPRAPGAAISSTPPPDATTRLCGLALLSGICVGGGCRGEECRPSAKAMEDALCERGHDHDDHHQHRRLDGPPPHVAGAVVHSDPDAVHHPAASAKGDPGSGHCGAEALSPSRRRLTCARLDWLAGMRAGRGTSLCSLPPRSAWARRWTTPKRPR